MGVSRGHGVSLTFVERQGARPRGLCVRRVLGAKVIGRSVELDPNVELSKTHALLEPED